MPRAAKKAEERKRDPTLLLFVSLNMILFAFFVLLVALSQPDKTKEAALAIEVKKAFQTFGGTFLGLGSQIEETGVSHKEELESTEQLERFIGELSRFIEENRENKVLSYEITAEGLYIHIFEDFAFEPGSAELTDDGRQVYDAVYNMMLRVTNAIRIEGHTDDAEAVTATQRDRWYLSGLRATTVFRYFTAKGDIPPERMAVVGYGPSRPLASNLTGEGRAKNRRVTIVFLGELQRLGEQP